MSLDAVGGLRPVTLQQLTLRVHRAPMAQMATTLMTGCVEAQARTQKLDMPVGHEVTREESRGAMSMFVVTHACARCAR